MSLVSLYDEASLWMTPSGAKDGRLFSELPVPVYGPELVRNGGFDSGTGWSTPSGWSISNGTLQGTNVAAVSATQAGITFLNKSFRVEYTITEISQGDVRIYLGGTQSTPNRNAVGTYVEYIDITTANTTLYIQGINNFTGKIDNISVKEVSNIGDFTFSRGSNLAATRVGPTGLIEKGRENLLPYSNAFTSGDWQDTGASYFTSGQSGYDGTNDAWRFTTVNQGERFQIVSSVVTGKTGVHTLSAYFKKGTADGVRMRVDMSGTDANIYVNLLDGNIFNSVGDIAAKLTDIGGGWYRAELTANWVNVLNIRIYPTNTTGNDAVGTIYIQSAQLEIGLAATDYIESGATTGKAGLLEDEPRLDYSGGATCPSLLLEPSRTNLVRQSEYFGDWIQSNTIITSNVAISPEGLQNASELEFTALTAEFYRTFSNVASSDHTGSIFLKNIDKNSVKVQLDGGTPAISGGCDVDLINGTISNEYGSVTAGIADFGNGWYRVHFGDDSNASTANPRFEVTNASTGSTLGSLYVYGAQAEVGSYPTSYIPNHSGGTVTRSRDTGSLNLVGAGINDGWTSGTILIEFEKPYNNENNDVIRIHGNSVSGRAYIYNNGYGFASDWSYSSNFTIGDNTKIIYRLNTLSTANLFKNGVKFTGAEGSGTAWSNIKYIYLNNQVGAKINIKQIVVFPTALTDSECIKLTTL